MRRWPGETLKAFRRCPCRKHYLQKEAYYGLQDLLTNNKGFRWWGIRRIARYLVSGVWLKP